MATFGYIQCEQCLQACLPNPTKKCRGCRGLRPLPAEVALRDYVKGAAAWLCPKCGPVTEGLPDEDGNPRCPNEGCDKKIKYAGREEPKKVSPLKPTVEEQAERIAALQAKNAEAQSKLREDAAKSREILAGMEEREKLRKLGVAAPAKAPAPSTPVEEQATVPAPPPKKSTSTLINLGRCGLCQEEKSLIRRDPPRCALCHDSEQKGIPVMPTATKTKPERKKFIKFDAAYRAQVIELAKQGIPQRVIGEKLTPKATQTTISRIEREEGFKRPRAGSNSYTRDGVRKAPASPVAASAKPKATQEPKKPSNAPKKPAEAPKAHGNSSFGSIKHTGAPKGITVDGHDRAAEARKKLPAPKIKGTVAKGSTKPKVVKGEVMPKANLKLDEIAKEMEATQVIAEALRQLSPGGRKRALSYAFDYLRETDGANLLLTAES